MPSEVETIALLTACIHSLGGKPNFEAVATELEISVNAARKRWSAFLKHSNNGDTAGDGASSGDGKKIKAANGGTGRSRGRPKKDTGMNEEDGKENGGEKKKRGKPAGSKKRKLEEEKEEGERNGEIGTPSL